MFKLVSFLQNCQSHDSQLIECTTTTSSTTSITTPSIPSAAIVDLTGQAVCEYNIKDDMYGVGAVRIGFYLQAFSNVLNLNPFRGETLGTHPNDGRANSAILCFGLIVAF
jgi:hypothetical protein